MHYAYVLKSANDDSLYIGSTNDLKRRFTEHNAGKNTSTRVRAPFELVYYEAYRATEEAVLRERNLKKFSRAYQQLKLRINKSID